MFAISNLFSFPRVSLVTTVIKVTVISLVAPARTETPDLEVSLGDEDHLDLPEIVDPLDNLEPL